MKFFLFLALIAVASTSKTRYDGYKVYHIIPKTEEHVQTLAELENSNLGVSFWEESNRVGKPADMMLPPHLQGDLIDELKNLGFDVTEFIANVQQLIDQENSNEDPSVKLTFTAYHRYPAIQAFLKEQAALHTTAEAITIGKTFENRDLDAIVIGSGTDKPIIFVEAGIHAREWIAGATANYLIDQLLNTGDAEIKAWVNDFEWHIVPIANPDGFEYSHTNTRLWRKTRSIRPGTTCRGCDPNRNWGFMWGTGGSSSQPCDDTYMGVSNFSEPETKALADYIDKIGDRMVFYLDLHAYSQLILLPYGVDYELDAAEKALWLQIGGRAADALKALYGTEYTVGNIVDLLYVASGGSVDWVKNKFDTELVFAYELRDQGRYGFLLPANQIIPTGLEFMDSLKSLIADLKTIPPKSTRRKP